MAARSAASRARSRSSAPTGSLWSMSGPNAVTAAARAHAARVIAGRTTRTSWARASSLRAAISATRTA